MGYSQSELDAAVARLTEAGALAEAQEIVQRAAPQLQRLLAEALGAGGWFEAHEDQVREAATADDAEQRARAVRTLVAEETRLAMMVGVAVGYELARQLPASTSEETA